MAAVTIVIPSYNHARFLPACLDSIRRQTFEDWQVVLIDDGSRDDSVEIARSYAAREPRMRVEVNGTNLGTYGTQQRGLDLTESGFVAVMNSDDVWSEEKLALQMDALEKNPAAPLCYVLGGLIDDAGRPMEGEDVHLDWPREEAQDILPWLLYENRVLASGVLFRREGLRFETSCRYSGDWVALIERAYAGPVACVPRRLTHWRQHGNNTYTISPRQMAEEIRVREAIGRGAARWFLPRADPGLVRRGLYRNAVNLVALQIYFHDLVGARRAGPSVIRYGGLAKTAMKRALSGFLPADYVRRYFWGKSGLDLANPSRAELSTLLSANEPLRFRLSNGPERREVA